MDQPIATHEDVTTIMRLIAEIRDEAALIRRILEEDDGEEEAEEDGTDA